MSTAAGIASPARFGREVKTRGHAWREFRGNRSPRIIAIAIVAAAALRIVLGGWSWWDAAAAAFIVVIYPFGEWAIHVHLLHLRPFRFRGQRVELATARAHREHHEQPNDLRLILLGPLEAAGLLLAAVPTAVLLLAALSLPLPGTVPVGALVTALLTGYVLVGIYEWTHFLIHTAYRPRSRYYRTIWRTHRLHHFKNERYWHGITNTVGDRVLGTFPDQRDVPRSPTARTLDPGPA
jgi:sterol desaturase/sphingolipid hydroxylase (fatty acid hydroxylase superfamily)